METRPIVITDNDDLLDDLLRVAAAAGVEVSHARSPDSRLAWRSASVILLDARQVRAAVLAGLPRRSGVVVVAAAEPDGGVWEHCVLLGVERTVVLPAGEDVLVAALADSVQTGPGGGRVIAVIGARGGAGASVFAAAVAVAGLAAGSGVLLVDCDPWGAGQDLLMGLEADPGLRWPDLSGASGRVPADALHHALPTIGGRSSGRSTTGGAAARGGPGTLSVLCHDRDEDRPLVGPSPESLAVVLDACRRAGELAVLDLPRTPDPVADQAIESADLVVLLATADVPCSWAARRVAERLTALGARLGLAVRGPSPRGLGGTDISELLEIPLIAHMRPQPGLAGDLEEGRAPGLDPRSPLRKAAGKVLAAAAMNRGSRP